MTHPSEAAAQAAFDLWWNSSPPSLGPIATFMAGYAAALLTNEDRLREALRTMGLLVAEAGGRVVIRRQTILDFSLKQSIRHSFDSTGNVTIDLVTE